MALSLKTNKVVADPGFDLTQYGGGGGKLWKC